MRRRLARYGVFGGLFAAGVALWLVAAQSPPVPPAARRRDPPQAAVPEVVLGARLPSLQAVEEGRNALTPTLAAWARQELGAALGNRSLAGVDTSHPFRVTWFASAGNDLPPVWRFRATDPQSFVDAARREGRRVDIVDAAQAPGLDAATPGATYLFTRGNTAFLCAQPAPVAALLRASDRTDALSDAPGDVALLLDVQALFRHASPQVAAHVQAMKRRMSEALAFRGRPDRLEQETATAHRQLDAAVAALRQTTELRVSLTIEPEALRLTARAAAAAGSLLAGFVASHPLGDTSLLRLCPADAAVVALHNVSAVEAVRRRVKDLLGASAVEAFFPSQEAAAGHTLAAMFVAAGKGSPIEVLEIRDGRGADEAEARWRRFASGGVEALELPVCLEPLPDSGEVRLARVTPNEAALGPQGLALVRRLLGPSPLAAQARLDGRSVLAVGPDPLRRIEQVRGLARTPALSPASDPAFLRSVPPATSPNALIYISPTALRQWLALGGRRMGEPGPQEPGLVAALTFSFHGVEALALLPSTALAEALRQEPAPATP